MKLTENQREWFIQRYCTWADDASCDLTKEEIRGMVEVYFDDFTIGNDALLDALLSKNYRQVSLSLLAYLYVFTHDQMMNKNPMAQDYMAESESVTGFMNGVQSYSTMIENSRDALENTADRMVLVLLEVRNHEQIGAEMGLVGKRLGVYDALRGFFSAAYQYTTILATRELCDWLFDEKQEHAKAELAKRIMELNSKYGLVNNERLANDYIWDEIMQWKTQAEKEEGNA